ncbi:MAG: HAMP domain-containing histidine kinase [Clostridiales bacterium]|jgi:signal transduction histidine kinase|nr:HAMP domain-containing histidine kinase [Clostridiales bacterium]
MGIVNSVNGGGLLRFATGAASAVLSFALMYIASRSGRYQLCYLITIAVIFIGYFPILFFKMGGYHGGKISFFIFALVFTAFMLEGKIALIVSAFELAAFSIACVFAYAQPELVNAYPDEKGYLIGNMIDFIVCGIALSAVMFAQTRLYRAQQKMLDEQNLRLEQASQMKTELFANVSHEMKTPLTVISVHIQRAEKLFELARQGDDEKIKESFTLVQEEVMRMARLVNNALRLSSMQNSDGIAPLDLGALIQTTGDAYRALIEKDGTDLIIDVQNELPKIRGNADAMVQVVSNLLSNSIAKTKNGHIRIHAECRNKAIVVTVTDDGEGIAPELMARVFERGVSDSGGSGLGLSICKQIISAHGGEVSIESVPGKGTKVAFSIPV